MKKTISKITMMLANFMLTAFTVFGQASLTSDLPDYPPGSTATFTGSGFMPNETVALTVHNITTPGCYNGLCCPWYVTADNDGSFTTTWTVCQCPGDSLQADAIGQTSGLHAILLFSDNNYTTLDFQQPINGDTPFPIDWTNGILNATQTTYYEGIGVPQRIIVTGLTTTTGNTHYIKIKHRTVKGNIHAYDFLISWDQAVAAATEIGGGPTSNELQNLFVQACDGGTISATGQAACNALNSQFVINASIPDGMNGVGDALPGGVPDADVDSRITCFETGAGNYGNRTIEIRGNAPFTSATVVFDGYESGANDADALYTISWVSASTDVMFLFAGHLSVSAGECGYGAGEGAGSISGGSYHISLDDIDGNSGSLDNQISSNAVTSPPPICNVTSDPVSATVCPGNSATLTVSAIASSGTPPYTYLWSDNSTGDHITVAPNTTTTYTVTVTDANDLTCSTTVTVTVNTFPLPNCSITGGVNQINSGGSTNWCATSGMTTYEWSGPNSFSESTECVDVSVEGDYTVTITDGNGCNNSCTRHLTVNQDGPPSIDCSTIGGNLGCNPASIPAADDSAPTVDGGCDPVVVTHGADDIQQNGCNYTLTRTYTATDDCQQTSSCNQVFTYSIATAPVFDNCTSGTTPLGCNPTLPSCDNTITAQNECGNVPVDCTPGTIQSNGCNRSQEFVYSATACGLTSTCTLTYTWTEATAPVFDNCTSGTTPLGCNPTLPSCDNSITAQNECGNVPVDCTPGTIQSNGCNRSQEFVYSATACGLTTTCTKTFTWTVAPAITLTCPPDQTISCGASIVWGNPTVSGGCNPSFSIQSTVDNRNGCGNGTLVRTWSASDGCGNTATCSKTITINSCGGVSLKKLTEGIIDPTKSWTFTLTGPGLNVTETTNGQGDGIIFENVGPLNSSSTYTICETNVPAGWSSIWRIDTNGDGTADMIIIPYNPDQSQVPPQDYGNRCFQFGNGTSYPLPTTATGIGCELVFEVDNDFPGGDPRTPGYWKNWASCSGSNGNQYQNAINKGGCAAGYCTLDEILTSPGVTWCSATNDNSPTFYINTCTKAVRILDQRDIISNKKNASDAAYTLAMHLLAAELNFAAGAEVCQAAQTAVANAKTLLCNANYDGAGAILAKPNNPKYAKALCLAACLDAYNNGNLCPSGTCNCVGPFTREADLSTYIESEELITSFPNPFKDEATILFMVGEDAHALLEVYSYNGSRVEVLVDRAVLAGETVSVDFNSQSLSPGMYLCKLQLGENVYYHKMIISK